MIPRPSTTKLTIVTYSHQPLLPVYTTVCVCAIMYTSHSSTHTHACAHTHTHTHIHTHTYTRAAVSSQMDINPSGKDRLTANLLLPPLYKLEQSHAHSCTTGWSSHTINTLYIFSDRLFENNYCYNFITGLYNQLKRSPTEGRGASPAVLGPVRGKDERSGRLAMWDLSSSLTALPRSNLVWYSYRIK